ncbi:Por secretion system C-terminal sorting domain-containing protein [Chryseobacterium sp. RU37D]|uniref:T9SS type A sorting domain-containing protein n=1 Tax=Chryseobacterium sp. RU37D TaxID=1907397 RepID=UPI0009573035|nr:T9SS type A sorting domain-containing protein [Chryseobacterium sp. RU37D]SIP99963.1 Por secretion system C-terminal sorting domain-containing protein [Chryseobacterium sp. RU37D]
MKKLYLLCLTLGSLTSAQQTITFNGCHELFENQDFVFNKTGVDAYNKNIYMTTPINDQQPCGGLGSCEFKIQWNNTLARWEFLADEGNGTFTIPYLIYYNSTGNNNFLGNPPAITFGIWVENTAITNGDCQGNLTPTNSTMTGDVHNSTLAVSDVKSGIQIHVFPNPVTDMIKISGIDNGRVFYIYNMAGQLIKTEPFDHKINVSQLTPGVYLLKIDTKNFQTHEFKFMKK